MIPLMGLMISFYIAMRGFDWIIMSKEAQYRSTFTGRISLGVITVVGAMIFALIWLTSGSDAPSYPPGV